jgi:hypothetical protein
MWHIHHAHPDEGARILGAILEKEPNRKANPGFQYQLSFSVQEEPGLSIRFSGLPEMFRYRSDWV